MGTFIAWERTKYQSLPRMLIRLSVQTPESGYSLDCGDVGAGAGATLLAVSGEKEEFVLEGALGRHDR